MQKCALASAAIFPLPLVGRGGGVLRQCARLSLQVAIWVIAVYRYLNGPSLEILKTPSPQSGEFQVLGITRVFA